MTHTIKLCISGHNDCRTSRITESENSTSYSTPVYLYVQVRLQDKEKEKKGVAVGIEPTISPIRSPNGESYL